MTGRTRYFVVASLLTTTVGVGAGLVAYYGGFQGGTAAALEAGSAELEFVPANATLVAFADVQAVMASELRQQLRRMMPARSDGPDDFEQETGISIERDIDHVVAAVTPALEDGQQLPASVLVLARGRFDATRIESSMRQHGAIAETHRGTMVLSLTSDADPNGQAAHVLALSFVEPGLVAVGSPHLVRSALDLREGGSNITSNAEVFDLVRGVDGDVWAVGLFDALRDQAKLPAEVIERLPPITRFSASGQVNGGLEALIRADAIDEQSANEWRDVVRGIVALGRLQTAQNPELQDLIDSIQIGGSGNTIALSLSLPASVFEGLGRIAGSAPPTIQ